MFPNTWQTLMETYASTQPTMQRLIEQKEPMDDYLRSLRFMMRSVPDSSEVYVKALTNLMDYIKDLERVAQSYHTMIRGIVHMENERANIPDFESKELLRNICSLNQEKNDVE
jgi:hypothetical protein